jgi:Immunoglobulin domain
LIANDRGPYYYRKQETRRSIMRVALERFYAATRTFCLAALATGWTAASAQNFDLSRDFTTSSNPHGVWSYGWETILGTGFTLVTQPGQGAGDNGVPYEYWGFATSVAPLFFHFPLTNTGIAISDGGQGVYPPGTVVFYTGYEGTAQTYGLIRFTAPSNGIYRLEIGVRDYLVGPSAGDTEFHVLSNNVPLLRQFLPVPGASGYTNTLTLAAGTTFDFAVGRGADNVQWGSGLNIRAVVTPISSATLPVIIEQPQSTAAQTGKPVAFSVTAEGQDLRYQWYRNGEPIKGATDATLAIRPVTPRDAGVYNVRVTSEGTVWSSSAVLTVQVGRSGRSR